MTLPPRVLPTQERDFEIEVVNTHVLELCCSLRLVGDDTDSGFSLASDSIRVPGSRNQAVAFASGQVIRLHFSADKQGPQQQVLEVRCADGTFLTVPLFADVSARTLLLRRVRCCRSAGHHNRARRCAGHCRC